MANILIGWELGAYSGHIRRIIAFADVLEAAGHKVSLALQRLDSLPVELRGRFALWQAPVWRRLLVSEAKAEHGAVASHADILARLGLDAPGMLSAQIAGWDRIIDAAAPDLVIAEYAPALLRAASLRIPAIAAGIGFDLPPPEMERFPSLVDGAVSGDEDRLLALANTELGTVGRAPIAALPGLFGADAMLVGCFTELDAYAEWRRDAPVPPMVPLPIPLAEPARGGEIFVYWPESYASAAALWDGLAQSRLPIRIHAPSLSAPETRRLAAAGFIMEARPVPFERIAARSRLIVSHGGAGTTASAFVAGLPTVIVPVDLEKMVQANAVARLGLGGWSAPQSLVAERFAADLRQLACSEAIAARARDAAADFRRRVEPGWAASLLEMAERLLG